MNENIDQTTGEIIMTTAPVNPMEAMLAKIGAKGIVQVTRTVLQQLENIVYAVRFEGAAYEGEELQAGKGSGTKMAPARLANIINLETGEKQSLIMNTVLEGELVRSFGAPKGGDAKGDGATGGYVGRAFMIRSIKPVDGDGKQKRYRVYQIAEIVFDGDEAVGGEKVADGSDPVAKDGKSKPKG